MDYMQEPQPEQTEKLQPHAVLSDVSTVQTTVFAWACPSCNATHSLVHMAQPKEAEMMAKGATLEHACRQCGALLSVTRRRLAALPGLGAPAVAPRLVVASR